MAGINPEKLAMLMGHRSRKMVYETYGRYVEELDLDVQKIKEFFGRDYYDLPF